MKALPPSEQPYEKCLSRGPQSLSDAELLAVILRSGTREMNARELALQMLKRFGTQRGLGFLCMATREELMSLPGIGEVKAVQLQAAGELSRRIARTRQEERPVLSRPSAIAGYFMEDMRYLDHEELRMALFNTKNALLREETVSVGTVNASLASPREIFLKALRQGAVSLVLVHNHPSGDPQPSQADIRLTKRLLEAGALLEVPVQDHIIIGDGRYCSLRESAYIDPWGS